MSENLIRKYYDVGPAAVAATNVYVGGATGWASGIADVNSCNTLWLTGLSQSDDDQGRVGQSIAIETLDVRVKILPDSGAAGTVSNQLRMIIFADNELDGVYPISNELLGATATTISTGYTLEFLQPGYFGRFKVISDKQWHWSNALQESDTHPFIHEEHHDMKSHRVMWDTTNNSAIGNAKKGHIFISFFFEANTVTTGGIISQVLTNPPGVQFKTRIRYKDV